MPNNRTTQSRQINLPQSFRYCVDSPDSHADMCQDLTEFGFRATPGKNATLVTNTNNDPLYLADIAIKTLPSGLLLSSSKVNCLLDGTIYGEVKRSLTLALTITGAPSNLVLGSHQHFSVSTENIAVLAVNDDESLVGMLKQGQSSHSLVVQIEPDNFSDAEVAETINTLTKATSLTSLAKSARLSFLANELANPSNCGSVGNLLAESYALELLALIIQANTKNKEPKLSSLSNKDRAKLAHIVEMMRADPSKQYTLSMLANEAGLSISSLKRKFQILHGQTVASFLSELRLERARQGIEQHGWSVGEASYYAGYRHTSNFTTAFRRKYGLTLVFYFNALDIIHNHLSFCHS